jgi:hypothetical protein
MKPSNCDWRFARTRFSCVGLIDLFDFDQKTIGQGGYRNTGT